MVVYLVEREDGYALEIFKKREVAEKWAKKEGDLFRAKYNVVEITVK